MFARVTTVAFEGIEARAVDVQVQIGPGLPAFAIVGLPDKAVVESRERVRGALNAIGLALPPKRITVNLAPADLPKEGSHYDLPVALGLMAATGAMPDLKDIKGQETAKRGLEVAARVTLARRAQIARYAALGLARIRTNAECDGALLEEIAAPDRAGLTLLREAADALALSARGYHRTLRVARTLADLDGEEKVARIHIAEALSYRGETLRRAQVAA